MNRDFLAFWRLTTLDRKLREGACIDYAASNKYSRVAEGDRVWLVSVRAGRLRLIGRIIVARRVDRDEAIRVLGSTDLWRADHYILPVEGTVLPVADIDVHHLVPELRFVSRRNRLLQDEDGLVSGSHLQTLRRLTGDSAQLFANVLGA